VSFVIHNSPPKRPVQQRLEEMLRLMLGFALLGAQPLEFADDVGGFWLERKRAQFKASEATQALFHSRT